MLGTLTDWTMELWRRVWRRDNPYARLIKNLNQFQKDAKMVTRTAQEMADAVRESTTRMGASNTKLVDTLTQFSTRLTNIAEDIQRIKNGLPPDQSALFDQVIADVKGEADKAEAVAQAATAAATQAQVLDDENVDPNAPPNPENPVPDPQATSRRNR